MKELEGGSQAEPGHSDAKFRKYDGPMEGDGDRRDAVATSILKLPDGRRECLEDLV